MMRVHAYRHCSRSRRTLYRAVSAESGAGTRGGGSFVSSRIAAGVGAGAGGCAAAALWQSADDGGAAPSEAVRFHEGLPRAVRDPKSGRFMNPWLTEDGKDPCQHSVGAALGALRDWWHWRPDFANGAVMSAVDEAEATRVAEAAAEAFCSPLPVDWNRVRAARNDAAV
eukprot:TRINITY_DN9603_c0_g2_i2.p2 TRINITY_DN9603_c0_g2~~TRINITY_DN9603_c0_g2_i2.p2  ORF type:complete len:169 (-),score=35.85 TRINITY_DN9603_c0_g2_i2:230-736(-)